MKIGIDIRPLQTGHKYRGIGEVTKQLTDRFIAMAAANGDEVVFYEYDYDHKNDNPKTLLNMPKGLQYSVIPQGLNPESKAYASSSKSVKAKYRRNQTSRNPIDGSHESDVFIQYAYELGVPANTKSILIFHDLIPLVFWKDYFESPLVPLSHFAARTTLRTFFSNWLYKKLVRNSLRHATKIIAISQSTKSDIVKFFHVKSSKIKVVHEGVDIKAIENSREQKPTQLPTKPYLLFAGAGDQRRRVNDLVDAYNNLKAAGHDIQLVLAGENFQSAEGIPNENTRLAVQNSGYKEDILCVGYVNGPAKADLFKNALAFVYPTLYEGFGIPVVESFLLGCPIITYRNSSIVEIGGEHAVFARDWWEIKTKAEEIIGWSRSTRVRRTAAAKKYAEQFTWASMAESIWQEIP